MCACVYVFAKETESESGSEQSALCVFVLLCCECVPDSAADGYLSERALLIWLG